MIPQPSATGVAGVDTFDLASISDENYLRHRFKRYLVAVAGSLVLAGMLALGVSGILTAVPILPVYERYFFAAMLIFVGYFCLALAWVPYRYWARPPVALSVGPLGIDFILRSGRRIHVPWARDAGMIELLERVTQHGRGRGAAYRIWVVWGTGDWEFMWRQVVPLTYTTEAAFRRVLEEARNHHLHVKRFDPPHALSLVPTVSRTVYVVSWGYEFTP